MLRNKNLVALVAGSTGGLGSATAVKLMELGAKVVGLDVQTNQERQAMEEHWEHVGKNKLAVKEKNLEWKEDLEKFEKEGKFYPLVGDVTSEKDMSDCLRKIEILKEKEGGEFKLAVNCAGVAQRVKIIGPNYGLDYINNVMNVNVSGAFNFSRFVLN